MNKALDSIPSIRRKQNKTKTLPGTGVVIQAVEHLSSKHEALNSKLSTIKKKKKKNLPV
jgi:hypothetical protein